MAKECGIVSWKELALGCALLSPGNAAELKTGDWRSMRPVIDREACIKCGRCYIFCPDMSYTRDAELNPVWDAYHCKGCGICAKECPANAIKMVEEME